MNILIDIGHPAHVHYYRTLAEELQSRGHELIWTVKDIPIARRLLDYYGFPYIVLSRKGSGLAAKAFRQILFDRNLLNICRRNKIDLAIGTSITITHLSVVSKVRSVFFEDDDDKVVPLSAWVGLPFASTVVSPDCLRGKQRRKDVIYYPGYHELAYLHPFRFSPDSGVLKIAGIKPGERYFIMRFNSFTAHHDAGVQGISLPLKIELTKILKDRGRIFITSEDNLEPELEEYRMIIPPEKIHSLMYYASLFIGDSQTMSSEAAMLGVPSLRCNSFAGKISYLEEQEKKYGLTYAFLPEQVEQMVSKLQELLTNPNLRQEWQDKRQKMLKNKIDVTSFWTWFIDNYPDSINEMKSIPDFFNRYK